MDTYLKGDGHGDEALIDQDRWLRWQADWKIGDATRPLDFPARYAPAQRAGWDLQVRPGCGDRILRNTRRIALGVHRNADDAAGRHDLRLSRNCVYVGFQRSSVRLSNAGLNGEIATPNEVSFHCFGETSVRESLGPEGDDHHWIAIESELLRDILRPHPLPADAGQATHCLRATAPISARLFFAQLKLFSTVASSSHRISASQLETMVIELLSHIIADALRFWQHSRELNFHPRPTCLRRRLEVIQLAKAVMAREYWNDLSLTELSRMLHCSSAHLSRVFHAATGFRLVDYRQQLRLRKGLFLLEHSFSDIGDIAVHLGFASHSHFTSSFHRSFGTHPSQFVKWKAESDSRSLAA
jgi:AraC-like DNA-binding protein